MRSRLGEHVGCRKNIGGKTVIDHGANNATTNKGNYLFAFSSGTSMKHSTRSSTAQSEYLSIMNPHSNPA